MTKMSLCIRAFTVFLAVNVVVGAPSNNYEEDLKELTEKEETDFLTFLLKRYGNNIDNKKRTIPTLRDGTCPSGYIFCSELHCVGPLTAQCDGRNDCGNCADEIGCSAQILAQSGCQGAQPVQSGNTGGTTSGSTDGTNGDSRIGQGQNNGNSNGNDGSDDELCDSAPGYCCDKTGNVKSNSGLDELRQQILNSHDYFRCLHGSPSMTMKSDLNQFAQEWAENLKSAGSSFHSDRGENPPDRGENILTVGDAWKFPKTEDFYGRYPVESWYSEIASYDFNFPQTNPSNGHFAQVVWKESVELGCGVAIEPKQYYDKFYVVCQYRSPGMLSNLEENVGNLVY
ncbi:uncharacterized protein LOC100366773 isoform X2 [Saccoglossus kowalevskii]